MRRRLPVAIVELERLEDLHGCERLQKTVWGFEDIDVVPYRLMAVMNRSGGLILGALRGPRLIGFAFGFPGVREGRSIFCSHMLAVLPSEQGSGIGYRLKLEQRRRLLGRGVELATWTFDPLEARNANLNVGKLGVVAWDYWRNLYGRTSSPLHRGLDTDRLVARWYLRSPRVRGRLAARARLRSGIDGAVPIHDARPLAGGLIAPGPVRLGLGAPRLTFAIPPETHELRRRPRAVARRWQLALRSGLEHYFSKGYGVADFVPSIERDRRRMFYVLDRDERERLEGS